MKLAIADGPVTDESAAALLHARRAVRDVRPRTANQLHAWVRIVLGFDVPRVPLGDGSDPPFAYLLHAFFEDRQPRDCLVWANRGGGKTQLGAIATLLDMLFKPGIHVRILGGSFEQSSRMYGYLRSMLDEPGPDDACLFADLLADAPTGQRVKLTNGSQVQVLSQSERAVRGQRVHKLRCDEIELFEPDVWRAAQLVTHSGWCGDVFVHGSIECMSTMHRPFGLMQRLIDVNGQDEDECKAAGAGSAGPIMRRVFRWSVLDVLERCEPATRVCEGCALWDECRGRARTARGFVRIDDVIRQKGRVGWETWQSEMLCDRPQRSDAVYRQFNEQLHVASFDVPVDQHADDTQAGLWLGGIDFGYRAPTVLLWAWLDRSDDAAGEPGMLRIVDELVVQGCSTGQILDQVRARGWPRPVWIGADPAGHQVTEHLGRSIISQWREAGYEMRCRFGRIQWGIAAVARRLMDGHGRPGLIVHKRCRNLIKSVQMYRYPEGSERLDSVVPVKDGSDHAADALRYLICNLDGVSSGVQTRGY